MSRRGFTIAESLFSAVILSLVMMAIFYLFPTTAVAQRKADLKIQAGSIAQRALESFRCRNFSSLIVGAPAMNLSDEEHSGVMFSSSVLVYQCGVDPNYLKGLRVTVKWSYASQNFSWVEENWVSSVLSN